MYINKMDFYMYKSICPRWYGYITNIRHIVVPEKMAENKVIDLAEKQSNNMTGSGDCNIQLLQKYHMLIEPLKSYAALTSLTFHGNEVLTPNTIEEEI